MMRASDDPSAIGARADPAGLPSVEDIARAAVLSSKEGQPGGRSSASEPASVRNHIDSALDARGSWSSLPRGARLRFVRRVMVRVLAVFADRQAQFDDSLLAAVVRLASSNEDLERRLSQAERRLELLEGTQRKDGDDAR